MPQYLSLGSLPRKRHIAHRVEPSYRNEGIYYEEVVSTQGFSRAHSIVYHLRPPTRVKHIEPAGGWHVTAAELPVLRHVHLKTKELPISGDPIRGRVAMFTNADVTMYRCRPAKPQEELFRNAVSEEIIFIHHGSGRLLSPFGVLPIKPYDYVVIPRCTTYQLEFDSGVQPDLLVIESPGSIGFPSRYLNPDGQFRLGAPFCERDLHGPSELLTIDREQDTPVLIKDGAKLSRMFSRTTRSTRSVGMAWSIRLRSTRTISNQSRGRSINLRRSIKRSKAKAASSFVHSPRECSITIPTRSKCPTLTRMCRATKCCITFAETSAVVVVLNSVHLRYTRTASRTGLIRGRSSRAGM